MRFELSEHKELKGIPSASGMEVTRAGIYVIGDNSPYLFKLNEQYEIIDKIQLFPERNYSESIIQKIQKPDLEAIAKGNGNGSFLLAFGSGSKSPNRDIMVEIDPLTGKCTQYSLSEFYSHLRSVAGLTNVQLNIEAAEVYKDHLFLFNRGINLIIKCRLSRFMGYLKKNFPIPQLEAFRIRLSEIEGIPAGFSGASVDPENGKILFTATVENTDNWIDDGEVLGSFIGIIELADLKDDLGPDHIYIPEAKNNLKLKVESIAVLPPFQKEQARVVMVTDSDGGISEILSGTLFY